MMRYAPVFMAMIFGLLPPASNAAHEELKEMGYDLVPVEPKTWSKEDIKAGEALSLKYCEQCHGLTGDGNGTMADRVFPRPRDLTWGIYKIRHTPSGEVPSDEDLFDIIARGMPGTSMPAWKPFLKDAEIWQLVGYVTSLAEYFEEYPPDEVFVITAKTESTPERIARGAAVYKETDCRKCHGDGGRGNGPSARELEDDWENKILATNLTQAWLFRGGNRVEDIFRTMATGMDGTPMPSFADSLKADDLWDLAHYIKSLGRERALDVVIRAVKVNVLPEDPYSDLWEQASGSDFALAGQIIVEPRWFMPSNNNITVKALFDGDEVGILFIWDDKFEDTGEDGSPPDAVAVQFPSKPTEGNVKPYFLRGDRIRPVDYWQWNNRDKKATAALYRGLNEVSQKILDIHSYGGYKNGQYRVVLRRSLTTSDDTDVQFLTGVFIPVAFHLWDGSNGEEGLKMAVSAWYYLLLTPEPLMSLWIWSVLMVLLTACIEVWGIGRLKQAKMKKTI
ncbi:MAG: c-type cytochrome [Gammaproteobacteria bacterium]|nr:c-type cytochrome [Gammaproteobacteria bacterium]